MATTTKLRPQAGGRHPLDGQYRGWPFARRDRGIERQVRALIETPAWRQTFAIGVEVQDGTVRLDGTCHDGHYLDRLVEAIAALPGVELVENEVTWVLPDCGMGRV